MELRRVGENDLPSRNRERELPVCPNKIKDLTDISRRYRVAPRAPITRQNNCHVNPVGCRKTRSDVNRRASVCKTGGVRDGTPRNGIRRWGVQGEGSRKHL